MQEEQSVTSDPDFLKFWVGQTISVFGAQFSPLAVQVIAIDMLKVSNFQLGLLGFLNTVPFLVLGVFVGVWIDRHNRRRTLLFANLGRCLVLASIPASYLLYSLTVNVLYIVTLAAGVLTVFFEIGYQTYIPYLVDKSKLVQANSRLEATRSLSQAAGPTAAGAVISVVSAPFAVLGDSVGYAASGVSLWSIRKPEQMEARTGKSTWQDIREGLRVVFSDSRIRAIAGTSTTTNLLGAAFGVVLTKFFLNDLGMSIFEVGLVYGIGSLGGVFGALIALRVARKVGVGNSIIIAAIMFSTVSSSFYFANPGNGLILSAAIMFASFIWVPIYNVVQLSYRQALIPKQLQGRMNATIRTISWGVLPIGSLIGGAVAQVVGVRETVVLMAVLTILAPLWVVFSPVRGIKEFPSG